MDKTDIQQESLLSVSQDEIESCFFCMDFAFKKLNAYDMDEAKVYLKQIIYHGNVSDTDMAIYYANMHGRYDNYVELKEDFELYPYIDHTAVKKAVKVYGNANIRTYIDYESLGKDMFQKDILIDAYYRFNENVFEITVEDIREAVDVDLSEYIYLTVQHLIDTGLSIEDAINTTYTNIHRRAA